MVCIECRKCKNLPGPDGLLLVELLILSGGLLDLLGLLGLLARVLVLNLLNLGVTLLDLLLLVLNLFLGLLGDDELDRVGDELGLGDTSSALTIPRGPILLYLRASSQSP